ncbi:hypothetical protein TYRP_005572 [Tyrophagus putrescentiae]|nr:hypothetical protein TYRP_005572 [Tyrophagus putrescentiae]
MTQTDSRHRDKDGQLGGRALWRVEQIEESNAVFEIAQLDKVIARQSPQIIARKVGQLLGETEEAISLQPLVRFNGAGVRRQMSGNVEIATGTGVSTAAAATTVTSNMSFSGHCGNAEKTTATTKIATAAACWNDIAHHVTTTTTA